MISQLMIKTLRLLGSLIKVGRAERELSQAALAERLGVARQTVIAIEKGDPAVMIGTVFEAAYILGIPLFSQDKTVLSKWQVVLDGFSGVLPERVRDKKQVNDDF